MRPEIENLKAWIYGKSTTGYQRALGMREFEKLLEYVAGLEQLHQPLVIGAVCPCNELPDGEIAISSKALQKPYGDLGQTHC